MSFAAALWYKTRCENGAEWRLVKAQPWMKILFILFFAVLCEGGLWWLFYEAFHFLATIGGIGTMLITRFFTLFFFGMGIMLILSSVTTSYSCLFRTEEIPYLLTVPMPMPHIILYRAKDAALLSSWSFYFIVIPFIGAYAMCQHLSPVFALWTALYSIPFLFLCCGLGTIVSLLSIRWAPLGRALKVVLVLLLLTACAYGWYVTNAPSTSGSDIQISLLRLIPGLNLASIPLLPSWWVSEGVLALQDGEWTRGLLLWVCTFTTAALVMSLVEWIGSHLYYPAWLRVAGSATRLHRSRVLFPWLERLRGLPPEMQALIAKDIRTFFRDPMQWSQTLIFFGLLALYFSNIRQFQWYEVAQESWRNMVAFLNVFSVSAVMCSLSARFVFPQLSLEGQGFWTIGLSPLTLRRVLLTKLLLAVVFSELVGIGLMAISCHMLRATTEIRIVAIGLAAAISLAVSCLSVGLGAVFMDLRQRNPAAIVSGFGGTLNLILSLGYILASIVPFAIVFHQRLLGNVSGQSFHTLLWIVAAFVLGLTAVVTVLPLKLGIAALAKREF